VAIKWFFSEPGSKKAIELKDKHIRGELSLYSRDLLLYEFTSAFRNYSSQKIEEKDFSLAVSAVMSLKMKLLPLEHREAPELFLISKKLAISVYDGSFLLLANRLKVPFYTADKKLYLKGKTWQEMVLI